MQKKRGSRLGLAAGIIAGILAFSGCADILKEPQAQSSTGEGRVTITIDGGARTVLPPAAEFSRFEVTGSKQGGTQELEPVEAFGGSAELVLPQGAWDVQVWAYNHDQPAALVARAANTLTNTDGQVSGNTRFVLEPAGTGPGVLAYRISVPAGIALDGQESRIHIEQNGIPVKTIAISGSVEGETSLEPGRYIVDVLLNEASSDKIAAQRETVVILPGLTTAVAFAPETLVEPVDTLTFSSLAEYRAYVGALPENTKENPYRISLKGIDLQDLWEGHDPLGQIFSVPGNRYLALDLSRCTGTAIGSLDDPTHMNPNFNPAYDPRPIGQYGAEGTIDANLLNRARVVSVMLPESLEIIGDFAFYWFGFLTSVALPESLKVIGHMAFEGARLTTVEIPDSVERIGIGAFQGGGAFKTLTSVKLPASLKEIPRRAFVGQPLSSIELPQGLEIIEAQAFGGTDLRSISFPDTVTTIGNSAFGSTEQLESVVFPASLTTLEYNAFRSSGIKSVDLSACIGLEIIQKCTFDECLSLESVQLPPNLKGIDDLAFADCPSLKVLDLPASVEIIDTGALEYAHLETLIVRSVEPPSKIYTPSGKPLEYDPSWTGTLIIPASRIYVPDASIDAYRESPWWGIHASKFRPLSEYQG